MIIKYEALKCKCASSNCPDWHVSPVADTQGVNFTETQARLVADALNKHNEEIEAAKAKTKKKAKQQFQQQPPSIYSNNTKEKPMTVQMMKAAIQWKQLWRLACNHDNIPEDSFFVRFSDANPYAKEANAAAAVYFEMRKKELA